MFKRIIKVIKHPSSLLLKLDRMNIIKLSDVKFLKYRFLSEMGYKLDLKNPKTFNEKLQWLKLHDKREVYTIMVDKYSAKEYVGDIIGKQYIIPTIGVYENFDEINFKKMPNKFVIKCTHDSGGVVIVDDKGSIDQIETKKKIEKSLKENYYYRGREWPYKSVKPRIIVEKYMIDKTCGELRDYKFFCFNGKVECFKIDFDRFINHRANYFNREGKLLRFGEIVCPPDFDKKLELPRNLNQMIRFAEKLSSGIPFLRVDFYEISGKIYFGELTLYPASGFGKFIPDNWDYKLGNLIDLDMVKNNEK